MTTEKTQNRILFAALAVTIVLFFWLGAPSKKDVEKCAEHTGWTQERCRVELSR